MQERIRDCAASTYTYKTGTVQFIEVSLGLEEVIFIKGIVSRKFAILLLVSL
jgi:hypothetical protein